MSSSRETSIEDVLQQLVAHFNQEIHQIEDNDNESIQPIFDFDDSNDLPKMLHYWMEEALPPSPSLQDFVKWIQGYETAVRPLLLDNVSSVETSSSSSSSSSSFCGYFPTMIHYELLLSHWWKRRGQNGGNEESFDTTPLQQRQRQTEEDLLCKTIELLSTDVTLLTSERYFPKLSSPTRSHTVLPAMLRLLDRVLQLLSLFSERKQGKDVNQRIVIIPNPRQSRRDEALRRCMVTLLAFQDHDSSSLTTNESNNAITPCDVAPCLLDPSQHNVNELLAFPPPSELDRQWPSLNLSQTDLAVWNQSLDLHAVDWLGTCLSTLPWGGTASSQAAEGVWKRLKALLLPTDLIMNDCEHDDASTPTHMAILDELGGLASLYKDVRAHFFGRDMVDWQPEMHTSQQVVLGRRVTKSQPVVSDPPHIVIPSRVAVALHSLRFLNETNTCKQWEESTSSASFWNAVMEEIFPIVATLVDSNRNFEIALGASGFLCLFHALYNSSISLRDLGEQGKTFLDNSLSLLDLSFKCSEGSATVAVGQAQYYAFRVLQGSNDGDVLAMEYRNRRQKTTQQWLKDVSRFYRPEERSPRWERLTGGIIPLLSQMASATSTADGMEIGRHGLSVLLPLLDPDTMMVDDETQVAAMIALINLVIAAHPIMPNHGGKILSSLLGAASLAPKDSAVRKLAVYAGAISLVVCGPKFTKEILSMVHDEKSYFQDRLKASATKIVDLAAEIESKN